MYIKFTQFMELSSMKKAKLVSGKIKEESIVNGGHVVELPQCWKWIDCGEILFMSGVGLKNISEELMEIVKKLKEKNIPCLVVETGPYIKNIPQEVCNLAEKMDFPIIEIPFNIRVNTVIDELYYEIFKEQYETRSVENFVRDLIYIEYNEDMKEKAAFYGYENNKAYIAVVMEFDNIDLFIEKHIFISKENIHNTVLSIIKNHFEAVNSGKMFYLNEHDKYILMLPIDESSGAKKRLKADIEKIQNAIKDFYDGLTLSAGIGNQFYRIADFKKSVLEAKRAIQMLHKQRGKNSIGGYDEIGIYRLFFELQDYETFESILKAILGRLIDYDAENNNNLVDTLEVYINNDRSISRAADELFLHRNTLKYRLNKIEEILMSDLNDVNTIFNLQLAYKLKNFITDSYGTY